MKNLFEIKKLSPPIITRVTIPDTKAHPTRLYIKQKLIMSWKGKMMMDGMTYENSPIFLESTWI
jgi:hypothetical protein